MSARHPGTYGTQQKRGIKDIGEQFYELSKQFNLQNIGPAQNFSLLSNGPSVNAGSTYPILYPFISPSTAASVDVDLSTTTANYTKISITTTDTVINFTNAVQNRVTLFTLDITVDAASTNAPTFTPNLIDLPTLPTTNGSRYLLQISGFKNSTEENYFVVGGTLTGAGSISPLTTKGDLYGFSTGDARIPVGADGQVLTADSSAALGIVWTAPGAVGFPIRPPIDDRGSVSTAQELILSNTSGHVLKFIATADIAVTFNNFPIVGFQQEWEVEVTQDVTGGRVITFPQALNPPVINTTANSTTIIVFRTNDTGATIRVGNTVTTTAGVTTLSDLTINTNKDWLAFGVSNFGALSGVTSIDLDGAAAEIQGVKLLTLFQAGQSIDSLTGGIEYSVGDLQSHLFKSLTDVIAKFEEITANVFRLNMFDHSIVDVKDFRLDASPVSFSLPGASPGLGFEEILPSSSRLRFNYPTGSKIFITENATIGSTIFTNNSIESNLVTANDLLQIGVDATVPSVVGEFRNDGTDVTVFSGGAVRNLSNITTAANTALSNLITTSINQNLIPQGGKTLGDSGNIWSRLTVNKITLGTAGTFTTTDNEIIADATTGMEFHTPDGDLFSFFFGTDITTPVFTMSSGEINVPNIQLQSTLLINDTGAFPAVVGQISRNLNVLGMKFDTVSVRRDTTVALDAPSLDLVRVDSGPNVADTVGFIKFSVFDTPTETTYAQIHTTISNVLDSAALRFTVLADATLLNALVIEGNNNSIKYQFLLGGTTPRIQPANASGPMGYFVTAQVEDFSLNIGSAGTLEIPTINDSGTITKNTLAAAFGAFAGAIGLNEFDDKLYIRRTANDNWVQFNSDAIISV